MAGEIEDAGVSPDDAMAIGYKVAEAADRVRFASKFTPGAVATWGFEMEGVRYTVAVRMEKEHAPE